MNLKISQKIAVETASQHPKNLSLQLHGLQHLKNINPELAAPLDDSNLFCNVFGLDTKFFYLVEKIGANGSSLFRERGLGHLTIENDSYWLVRSVPISVQYSDGTVSQCNGQGTDFYAGVNEYVVVSSTYPANHVEVLHEANCVIASSDRFVPLSVQLSDYSLLGKLKDEIRAISFSDFSSIPELQEAILVTLEKYSKQIELSCSKLSLKNKRGVLSSSVLQLDPTSNPPSKAGTIIFDQDTKKIKFYDGNSWHTINTTEVS